MRRLRRILLLVVVIILLLAGALTGYVGVTLRKILPQTGGTLTIAGLNGPVTIYRDASGIPQIYASSTHDLFFGQGLVQAQDRWWLIFNDPATAEIYTLYLVGALLL